MDRIVTIWSNLASVGWYLLAIVFSLWYISPYLKEKYLRWRRKWEEEEYSAKYHKDPDMCRERLAALDACRQQMQQVYSAKAASILQEDGQYKQKKKEIARRMEKALDYGGVKLGRNTGDNCQLDSSPSSVPRAKSLKSEYNPLMGDGARGYRPPKRSCCRKSGGCG